MNFKDAEKLNSKKLCDVTFGKGKRKTCNHLVIHMRVATVKLAQTLTVSLTLSPKCCLCVHFVGSPVAFVTTIRK